jgi:integrase
METAFKKELEHKLLTDKKLAESSVKLYLRNLEKLNDNHPLKNLTFLKDVPKITGKLADYKDNTKRGYLISVTSVLSLDKTSKPKQKLYEAYFTLMMDKNKELKAEESSNTKSETQEKNWLTWEEVEKHWNDLKQKVDSFASSKELNEHQYNTLLQFVVLSLYVCLPPRRNEYQKMVVSAKATETSPTDTNYLDVDGHRMIFNQYKTAKKEGQSILPLPESLWCILSVYLKHHPLIKGKITKKFQPVPFLVYADGKPLDQVNSITRILNKTFGKKVGSSMLRHIYLSSKYGDINEQQKKDAESMGHSVDMARDYIKK